MFNLKHSLKAINLLTICLLFHSNSSGLHAQSCNCTEYLYISETGKQGLHKFAINPDGSLTEVQNAPGDLWYPGTNTSELPVPHGIAADQAGYLYVGESQQDDGDIRRLSCDGEIMPATGTDGWSITDVGVFNLASYENTLYAAIPFSETDYPGGSIQAFDFCTSNHIGAFCGLNANGNTVANMASWDFHIDPLSGNFYSIASGNGGRLYKFTAADLNGDCVTPITTNLYSYSATSYSSRGIAIDAQGYIYVVMSNFGTSSEIMVFDPNGNFVTKSAIDDTEGDGGWYGAISINYSPTCDCLYTANWTSLDDCVSRWTFDSASGALSYDGAAVGPVSLPAGAAFESKASEIITECCPTSNLVIDTALCATNVNEVLLIKDLMECDGVICEGPWTPDPANSGMTFDACDNSITITSAGACGSFTNNSDGSSGSSACGAYSITLNIDVMQNDGVTIAGNQTICQGDAPALLTSNSLTAGVNYQWQQSGTSCAEGFVDIVGANASTYSPPAISSTTYYRLHTALPGTCSSDTCDAMSNCVTVITENCCPASSCSNITVTQN